MKKRRALAAWRRHSPVAFVHAIMVSTCSLSTEQPSANPYKVDILEYDIVIHTRMEIQNVGMASCNRLSLDVISLNLDRKAYFDVAVDA